MPHEILIKDSVIVYHLENNTVGKFASMQINCLSASTNVHPSETLSATFTPILHLPASTSAIVWMAAYCLIITQQKSINHLHLADYYLIKNIFLYYRSII
jgi:hypothetical protein